MRKLFDFQIKRSEQEAGKLQITCKIHMDCRDEFEEYNQHCSSVEEIIDSAISLDYLLVTEKTMTKIVEKAIRNSEMSTFLEFTEFAVDYYRPKRPQIRNIGEALASSEDIEIEAQFECYIRTSYEVVMDISNYMKESLGEETGLGNSGSLSEKIKIAG